MAVRDSKGRFVKGHEVPFNLSKPRPSLLGNKNGFKKGQVAWNKGIPHTLETRKKIRLAHIGKMTGKDNPNWLGDDVSYRSLHKWVDYHLGSPSKCVFCGNEYSGRKIHWANVSGKYHRDVNDWIRLCAKCHFAFDRERGLRGHRRSIYG